jgi:hypothetical protein
MTYMYAVKLINEHRKGAWERDELLKTLYHNLCSSSSSSPLSINFYSSSLFFSSNRLESCLQWQEIIARN